MPAKLIVTGLEEVRGEALYDLFDVFGLIVDVGVDLRAAGDEATGYVVYEDDVCALRARLGMDGTEVNGRRIEVRPMVPEPGIEGPPIDLAEPDDTLLLHPR
jgi:RNA recognition motif-containing protein